MYTITRLSTEFDARNMANPEFRRLALFEQNILRLDWISAQMEAEITI